MKNRNNEAQSLTDISVIIEMMPEYMKNKINGNFIKFVEENKDKNYVSTINKNIPLEKQKINLETKAILALIYRDYMCTPEERKKLIREEKIKINRIEEENKKKYKIIFKKKVKIAKDDKKELIVLEKDSIIKKIFKFIRQIFISY